MRTLALLGLVAVLGIAATSPESNRSADEAVFRTEGAFFALSVADLAASTAWYRDKLGLSVVMEVPPQGGAAVTVLEGNGLTVELLKIDAAQPRAGDPTLTHGFTKAGMVVKHFDRTLERLRARGVEVAYGPFPANGTQRANVIVRDNAGNLIQLFGDGS